MSWFAVLAFLAAALIIGSRIFFNVRKVAKSRAESWDEKLVGQLRAKGYQPFNDYPVDFFLALPDEAACAAVRGKLEAEGFGVDVRPVENANELKFSLHAKKSMRIITPMIQEMTRHLTTVAEEHGGQYDGWTA
jgi:hypothetical protein